MHLHDTDVWWDIGIQNDQLPQPTAYWEVLPLGCMLLNLKCCLSLEARDALFQ